MAAVMLGAAAIVAGLLPSSPARAQSYIWGGGTTFTPDYGAATNWSNTGSAPPIVPSQLAIFGSTGSGSVIVGGPVGPASWTFNADAQAYSISGANVLFGLAGASSSGIFNNANTGVTISISNNIIEVVAGAAQVQQLGNSTLVLSGNNDYSGGTLISAGTVRVTTAGSAGTGAVTLNGGTFQAPGLVINNDFKINSAGGTVDNQGTVLALAGNISNGNGNNGVLQLIDSTNTLGSEVVLSGTNNTYTGGTTVLNTAVQVNNNNSVGTGTVTLDNATFLAEGSLNLTFTNNFKINNTTAFSTIDANGTRLTIAGNISDGNGPGQLRVQDSFGGGAVVLLGSNTYSGGTFICSCGTLQLGDATHTASIVGAVENEGVLNIVNANTSGITSIINDGGLTTFRNATSAGTMTITNLFGGETDFVNSSSAGSANISNQFAITTFGRVGSSDTSTAGQATITNDNGGTIFLAKTNAGTATITNIDGGGVIFQDQASAASATIINNDGGFTSFGQPGFTDTPNGR